MTHMAALSAFRLVRLSVLRRPADPGITSDLTVLARDNAGNAAAWVKHYVPGDAARGFVRLWDTTGTPPVEDVISVAESKGTLVADLDEDGTVGWVDFFLLLDEWLDEQLWPY